MRLQIDRKIEIVRLIERAPGLYAQASDPDDPSKNAPALNEGPEFAPDIAVKQGDLLLVKVIE
jgi:hypothetical protein